MSALVRYSASELASWLTSFPGWNLVDAELEKEFLFKNFSEALGFMVQVGLLSETLNHHPTIHNVYSKVVLRISTHSEQAITSLDKQWIEGVEKVIN